jgi:alkanesulfonate monooxygenase SsuD/methylene tetrahydromethanopterin reductase-like flavin-dependent oxidoreductase (luciferase family)
VSATLDFGLFLDLRNPDPWRLPWAQHLGASLDLAVEAERLGAGSLWFTEHHLFEDGHLAQPLTWLAAVAARTTSVRLGTGVVVAPFQHPRHLAEQAALVDALSGGRLELGLGPGYAHTEFAAFGLDPDRRFGETDRILVEVRRLLSEGRVGPQPVQDEVPLWLGYQGPRNAARAGRLGVGVLTLNRRSHAPYLAGLVEAGFAPESARMAGTLDIVVAEDPETAWERIRPHHAHQLQTYVQAHDPAAAGVDASDLGGRFAADRPPGVSVRLSVLSLSEAVDEVVRRIEGLPVRHVYTWASVAGMPADLVAEHVRLFLTEVAPAVRARLEAAPA